MVIELSIRLIFLVSVSAAIPYYIALVNVAVVVTTRQHN